MGKNQHGICTSPETATKQENFTGILSILMPVAKTSMKTWGDPYFWIYDLNAARSFYEDDDGNLIKGSAVRGIEAARYHGLNYKAVLCELMPDNAADLVRYFGDDKRVTVLTGDNEKTLPSTLPHRFANERFGYVYVDPNDARLPIDMLADMFDRKPFKRVDLIVNIAAASLKRMINHEDYDDIALDSLLSRVAKKTWLVREPHARHQWSLLIGTNWAEAPEWRNAGFYRMDTDRGEHIWRQLSKTKKQVQEEMQLSIFS